jgi:glycosyltransferase involved in cell wall biosynthesis
VDDGSTDATAKLASFYVQTDSRFHLIKQPNGGVARARNTGIAAARGRLIAPCDSDDLWGPYKLQTQLDILRHGGPEMGLVYSWSAVINGNGQVMNYEHAPDNSGWVFDRMCRGNLIGNGSAVLMLKDAVIAAGGYDASLRDRGAQGCEDFKLYTKISANHTFGVARTYDIGYRHTDGNMSSDFSQMLRSFEIVMDELKLEYPDKIEPLTMGRADLIDWFRMRAWRSRHWFKFLKLHFKLVSEMPAYAHRSMYWSIIRPTVWRTKAQLKSLLKHRRLLPPDLPSNPHPFIGTLYDGALWAVAPEDDEGSEPKSSAQAESTQ